MDTRHIAFLELFNSQVQYVVPRWQRRYCWGESDIKRLVDDLMAVARSSWVLNQLIMEAPFSLSGSHRPCSR